jgi:cytochrome P450
MALFPEAQLKAQAQIDMVVGHNRLPTFDDLERTPYVQALFNELLRWQPVLPLGRGFRVWILAFD